MSRCALLLLGCLGCGEVVQKIADAPQADAPHDSFACSASTLECSPGVCVDPMTDDMHCGTCTTACTSVGNGCVAGSCVDLTASCAVIHARSPAAPSGPYTHAADNTQFFCDMSKGINAGPPPIQYDELAVGQYNLTYAGYTMIDGMMLADAITQQAFIFLFDHQNGGSRALTTWSPGNVCYTVRAAGGLRLSLNNSIIFPAQAGVQTSSFVINQIYSFDLVNLQPAVIPAKPIGATFFQTNPPGEVVNCGDSNNPALYFKRH